MANASSIAGTLNGGDATARFFKASTLTGTVNQNFNTGLVESVLGLQLNGGTINNGVIAGIFNGTNGATLNSVQINAGTFAATSQLSGAFTISGTVVNHTTLDLDGGVTLSGTGSFGNAGTLNVTGGPATFSVNLGNTAGTVNAGTQGIVLDGASLGGGTINGLFTGKNGAGLHPDTFNFVTIASGSTFAVSGHVNQLQLQDGVTLTGTGSLSNRSGGEISLASGSSTIQVNISGGGSMDMGSISTSSGTTVTFDGATITTQRLNGHYNAINGATLTNDDLSGITLSASGGAKVNGGSFDLTTTIADGSTLGVAGTVTNLNTLDIGNNVTLNGTGSIVNGPGTTIQMLSQSTGTIGVNISGTAAGAGVLQGGTTANSSMIFDGNNVDNQTLTGTFGGKNGAIVNNSLFSGTSTINSNSALGIKGTVTVSGDLFLNGSAGSPTTLNSIDTFFVVGGILFSSPGTLVNNNFVGGSGNLNVPITNNGAITAQNSGQALVLGADVSGNGTVAASAGGILTLNNVTVHASNVIIDTGSKLNGTGTIVAPVGVNGTVAPGDAPGLLTINGNYTQNSTGTLLIEIGGAGSGQFSVLDITGNAVLGGALDVELFGAFDPSQNCGTAFGVCDTFDIVNVGGSIGSFNWASNFLHPSDGLTWSVSEPTAHEILLTVSGTLTSGGGGGGGTATPEPANLILFGSGLLGIFWRLRRPRKRSKKLD